MKFIIGLIFILISSKNIYGQLDLLPVVFEKWEEDSFRERYQYFKSAVPEYYTGFDLNVEGSVFKVNHLTVSDNKKFDFRENYFLENLKKIQNGYPNLMFYFIDTSKKTIDINEISMLFQLNYSDTLIPGSSIEINSDFVSDLKYLDGRFNLSKVSLFRILPLPELYVYVDNNIYVLKEKELICFSRFLKKKYKSRERFLKELYFIK